MGKAKHPLSKGSPSKPLKISTSLFKRRLSKNSTGSTKEPIVSTKGGNNKKGATNTTSAGSPTGSSSTSKGKVAKEKEESKSKPETSTSRRTSTSPTPKLSKKKNVKKGKSAVSTPPVTSTKAEGKKSTSTSSTKGKPFTKGVQKRKETFTSTRPPPKSPRGRSSRSSTSSSEEENNSSTTSSSSSSSENNSSESGGSGSHTRKKKVTTKTRTKSKKIAPKSTSGRKKPNKSNANVSSGDEDEDDEDGSGSGSGGQSDSSNSGSDTDSSPKKKKPLPKRKVIPTKGKGVKKGAGVVGKAKGKPTLIASKKKLVTKAPKSAKPATKPKTKKEEKSEKTGKNKGKVSKDNNKKAKQASTKKPKVKPRAKFKRMASLNAKAILEASFSFENQEKRQRSPGPGGSGLQGSSPLFKVKDEQMVIIQPQPTVSPTSPSPTSTFIPIQNLVQKKPAKVSQTGSSGERKRKSSDVVVANRRESTNSKSSKDSGNPNHVIPSPTPKQTSRRNSVVSGEEGKQKKAPSNTSTLPKKKKVSTTSTSTGTSPPPVSEFYLPGQDKHKKPKVKKTQQKGVGVGVGVDSATGTYTGGDGRGSRTQESGVQVVKSTGSQAKERKSSVAHFGTVYQPAGPLIEPHKTSVPSGLLPETVKLPPDLKVTYQTHPPNSNNPPSTLSHPHPASSSSKASSSSGSSRKHATTTTTKEKSGQILHQPYKSSQSTSTSRHSGSYSGSGTSTSAAASSSSSSYIINPATATGSPLLLSSPAMSHPGHGHHHHQSSQSQQLPSASAGAPSAGGLFYSTSTGYAPHHSPFAPNKYPMVPPESYRTHSPYQNSFLYPSTTPAQQSQQSYFMTPFYTPPLTPNSNPVMTGGLGTVVGGHHHVGGPRPSMSLTHPSIAAASFYAPQSHPQPGVGGVGMHPSSYLVASPHHSLQPNPTAPGHAGLFPPNRSIQPACPCPMESCPPNNTNNSKLQQQPFVSNVLHPVLPEGGANKISTSYTKALSSSRRAKQPIHPTCTTPTADTPPITIQLLTSSTGLQDVRHHSQARQLESAKTFTEQYSLPDDITITPIIVNNNSNSSALLLKNTSISLISPPNTTSPKSSHNASSNTQNRNTSANANKKKEKDIVHVIDPRSGLKTTIAKHISNRNLLVNAKTNVNKNYKSGNLVGNATTTTTTTTPKPGLKKIGVGKLNPDLDVIVINNNSGSGGTTDCDDSITENLAQYQYNANRGKKSPPHMQKFQLPNKKMNKSLAGMSMLQQNITPAHGLVGNLNRRAALTVNDNSGGGVGRNSIQSRVQTVPINYSIPPGISISSGVGNTTISTTFTNQNQPQGLNLSVNKSKRPCHIDPVIVHVQPVQNHQLQPGKGKKRISLNECIDGLREQKRSKLLQPNLPGLNGKSLNGNVTVIAKAKTSKNFQNAARLHSALAPNFANANGSPVFSTSSIKKLKLLDSSYSSARVRDPQLHRGGTVIKSSDAVAAVSAVVVDPDTYHLKNSRLNTTKGLKNGFKKGTKFHQGKNSKSYLPPRDLSSFVVGVAKVKSKGMSLEKTAANYLSTRNTRSTAANAKIRTRFSNKNTKDASGFNFNNSPRNRSRLLRKGNQIIGVVVSGLGGGGGGGGGRRSESDSSTNTSRSNSAVRIINGNVSSYSHHNNGKMERENRKYPTAAFINAVADLYQYRRNVLLRVPRASVGVFPCANSINLNKSLSPVSPVSMSPSGQQDRVLASQQLSPFGLGVPNHNEASLPQRPSSPATTSSGGGSSASKGPIGSMAANAAKKRAGLKPLSPAAINGALLQMGMARRGTPKWSNGWRFEGEPYDTKVFLNNDDQSVFRRCYPAMRHESGDVIQTRDCVLLKSGSKKNDLPFIAKIASLWENPGDGEMMFSLLWYYRPEHTEMGRAKEDMPDEIFASKHIDVNSVATIDDRCYVLTFNEYSRYRKRLKQLQEGLPNKPLLSLSGSAMHNNNAAGNIAAAVWNGRPTTEQNNRPTSPGKISPEVVFFCRKVYDFRQKRIMKNPS